MRSIEEKAIEAIRNASPSSTFYIGCDSSVSTKEMRRPDGSLIIDPKTGRPKIEKSARYVVVFIVHKDSSKGASILHEEYTLPEYGNLKQRLLNEANYAIDLAMKVLDYIGDRRLEIHLDINPNPRHKSHVAVKEALAYAKGMGLDAKVKPHSFAASHAADHLT